MRRLILLVLLGAALSAQDRLHTFQAVICDSHGNPVPNLNVDDLQLADNGKHFAISVFRANGFPVETPLPGVYSNRAHAGGAVTLILVDLVNLSRPQLPYIRDRLMTAFERTETSDQLVLYFLTSKGLVAARALPANPYAPPDNSWIAKVPSWFESLGGGTLNDADRPAFTASGLEQAANLLSGFPGRKSVLWITDGFIPSLDGIAAFDSDPFLVRVRGAFQPTGITLNVVAGFAGVAAINLRAPGNRADRLVTEAAEQTGGHANLERDIVDGLRAATGAAARPTYTIGYYPGNWNRKEHALELKCARRNCVVHAPETYLADPDLFGPRVRTKAAVERAAAAIFDSGAIGIQAAVTAGAKLALHLELRINAADLRLFRQDEGSQFAGDIATAIVFYDSTGAAQLLEPVAHSFQFTEPQRQAALKSGIGLSDERDIPPNAVRMRVIVFDVHSNAVGSITIPISVVPHS